MTEMVLRANHQHPEEFSCLIYPPRSSERDLMAALELLGIPSAGTRRVQIFPDCIIVEQLRRDASGSLFSAGADIATVKTVIGLEKE